MSANPYQPAITALEQDYEEGERKQAALLGTINTLREKAGMPPRQRATGPAAAGASSISEIRSDTFYGKKMQTAAREYLEMRKAKDLGPATPREIFDALKEGGYQFGASSDDVAIIGLRAMLRKRTQFFHKLPNGVYGLTAWYPHAKPAKPSDDDDAEDGDE